MSLATIGDEATSPGPPTIVVGDFNASRWHPPFRRLLRRGLRDSHEWLGHGFSTSWPNDWRHATVRPPRPRARRAGGHPDRGRRHRRARQRPPGLRRRRRREPLRVVSLRARPPAPGTPDRGASARASRPASSPRTSARRRRPARRAGRSRSRRRPARSVAIQPSLTPSTLSSRAVGPAHEGDRAEPCRALLVRDPGQRAQQLGPVLGVGGVRAGVAGRPDARRAVRARRRTGPCRRRRPGSPSPRRAPRP